jgi:hypothetical protein
VKTLTRQDYNEVLIQRHTYENADYAQRASNEYLVQRIANHNEALFNFAKIGIQPKLKVSHPGDEYEQEADRVAEQVMRMPLAISKRAGIDRECSNCELNENQKMEIGRTTSLASGLDANDQATNEINNIRSSGGSPLDANTREFMESRFGYDFSRVKIHTDETASRSSNLVNALAYTVGNNIVFEQGQYQPNTVDGKRLLAHELAHVVQQSESHSLGRQLKTSQLMIQRSIATSGGEWDTDQYDLVTPVVPAGARGVDITLRFKPGSSVDAELIGLTQSVISFVKGAPSMTASQASVAIPSKDAITINTGPGETDETAAIDRASSFNNPIYAVKTVPSTSLSDTNTAAGWGQLGWRYTDSSGSFKKQDATLIDAPRRGNAEKDSRHIFETVALATKGAQTGTYYGSVRWGWRTDSSGTFTKIPLTKVSEGVPSSTFMKAGQLWNAAKTSTGDNTVDLPIVDVKTTTAQVTLMRHPPFLDVSLPSGTRLQIIREWSPPFLAGEVKVIDGPHTGLRGEVSYTDWRSISDERP